MYKKRLILKITDIVNASEFLDNNIIKISKNLNQEKLEKLLLPLENRTSYYSNFF